MDTTENQDHTGWSVDYGRRWGRNDPRVEVQAQLLDGSQVTGVLCDDSFYGDLFEIADRGIRTSVHWRDVAQLIVLKPGQRVYEQANR